MGVLQVFGVRTKEEKSFDMTLKWKVEDAEKYRMTTSELTERLQRLRIRSRKDFDWVTDEYMMKSATERCVKQLVKGKRDIAEAIALAFPGVLKVAEEKIEFDAMKAAFITAIQRHD